MANMEEIERELRQYIKDSANLDSQDRFTYLKVIFDKHLALEKTNHLLTIADFHEIVGYAKSRFPNTVFPLKISKREMYPQEATNVLLIDAVLTYLNKAGVLKKLVKIDYTK